MKINRVKNTISGTLTGVVDKGISLIIPFIIRTIFIHTLGMEYLGLNSLFTSVLQVLNLMELGVGSAMVYNMYKPIAEDDPDKICALMRLYRKYYRLIGLAVCALGLLLIPFLKLLIKDEPPADINLYIIYLMSLASTILSYWLFAYRNCLFQAHQRVDIINILHIVISVLCYGLQIALLLIFRNYYIYLSITILSQVLNNIVTAILSKKYYPDYSPKGELDKNEIREINKKVASLFTAKIGTTVHKSFDTIVVSAFLGLSTLAVFQNYNYIITSLTGIIMMFYNAAKAGVGNYLVANEPEKKKELLYKFQYISMLIAAVCCSCLISLYQPFMKMWVGEGYLLDFSVVILIVIAFAIDMFMRPVLMFKDSGGMWNEDKFRPLVAALANLILNLATVKWLGLYGVIASTIVSMSFIAIPWLLINVNKYQFQLDIKRFILTNLLYTVIGAGGCAAAFFICSAVSLQNSILDLAVRLVISAVIPFALFEAAFFKTRENRYIISLALSFLKRKKR